MRLPAAALLLAACAGQAAAPAPGAPPTPAPPALSCGGAPLTLGPTVTRRLAREEYRNTVADLFGVPPPDAADLPEDDADRGHATTAGQRLTPGQALKYLDAAEEVATTVARAAPRFFPCATDGLDEARCVRRFLETTGTRIFRRRLTAEEVARFEEVFTRTRAAGRPFEESAAALVQALLISPQFLFLMEGGPLTGTFALDSWALAARLSYLLWRTTPDALPLEAAARDELRSPEGIARQVSRLLAKDRARPAVAAFFDGWLHLDRIELVEKDRKRYPDVDRELMGALAQETRRFLEESFWKRGALADLLVSPVRVRSARLSKFYGDTLSDAREPRVYEAEVTEKSFGLLSQSGLLMAMGHNDDAAIIHRGKFLRQRVLCKAVPPPPPGAVGPLPKIEPGMTGRERVDAHTGGPACFSCHDAFNPLGYALEHFDGAGRWRDTDGGKAVDATTEEIEDSDIAGPIEGALDL